MRRTVLIVEDEYLIASDLRDMLEGAGWQVMGPAATVRDALALLDRALPSVALLDVNLGTELVTPVAEALRLRGVPFALASAYARPEEYGGEVLAGVPNVGKPATAARLAAILARLVAEPPIA